MYLKVIRDYQDGIDIDDLIAASYIRYGLDEEAIRGIVKQYLAWEARNKLTQAKTALSDPHKNVLIVERSAPSNRTLATHDHRLSQLPSGSAKYKTFSWLVQLEAWGYSKVSCRNLAVLTGLTLKAMRTNLFRWTGGFRFSRPYITRERKGGVYYYSIKTPGRDFVTKMRTRFPGKVKIWESELPKVKFRKIRRVIY